MKTKIITPLIILYSMIFLYFTRPIFAAPATLEEMVLELKCPEDQETLEHQHGCQIHAKMLKRLEILIFEGKTKDEILDIFNDEFGPGSLVNLRKKGFGLLAYLVPILGLTLALTLISAYIGKWIKVTKTQEQMNKTDVKLESKEEKYEKQFDDEYKAFKG